MKTKVFFALILSVLTKTYAQVGIGTNTPSAMLDIVTTGNTSATKALEINNSSAVEMVTVLNNGNVGIGTNSPSQLLHTYSNTAPSKILMEGDGYSVDFYGATYGATRPGLTGQHAWGTKAAPLAVGDGSYLLFFGGKGYDGTGYSQYSDAVVGLKADGNMTPTSHGAKISFETTSPNTLTRTEKMVIKGDGNVGIGTATPSSKLHVAGGLTIADGTQGAGKILVSNASGLASWSTAAAAGIADGDAWGVNGEDVNSSIRRTGQIIIGATGSGYAQVNPGNATQTGHFTIHRANNTRLGYIGWDNTDVTYVSENGADHVFYGNVGVGTASPQAPLHVAATRASDVTATQNWGYFRRSNSGWSTGANQIVVGTGPSTFNGAGYGYASIIADGAILSKQMIMSAGDFTFSDARIKNIKGISNASEDLATLNKIQITDYTMKDVVENGNVPYKKVVAQQLEDVYPQAVKTTGVAQFIPNVYALATSTEAVNENTYKITTAKAHGISATAKKIRLEVEGVGTISAEVVALPNAQTLVVRADKNLAAHNVFVYGEEVSDFRAVDYEAISMLNVSATQELSKQLDAANAKIEALMAEIKEMKAQQK